MIDYHLVRHVPGAPVLVSRGVCSHVRRAQTAQDCRATSLPRTNAECLFAGHSEGWGRRSGKAVKRPDVERVCTRTAGMRSILFTVLPDPSIQPRVGAQ